LGAVWNVLSATLRLGTDKSGPRMRSVDREPIVHTLDEHLFEISDMC
jgi:hypothetical protein